MGTLDNAPLVEVVDVPFDITDDTSPDPSSIQAIKTRGNQSNTKNPSDAQRSTRSSPRHRQKQQTNSTLNQKSTNDPLGVPAVQYTPSHPNHAPPQQQRKQSTSARKASRRSLNQIYSQDETQSQANQLPASRTRPAAEQPERPRPQNVRSNPTVRLPSVQPAILRPPNAARPAHTPVSQPIFTPPQWRPSMSGLRFGNPPQFTTFNFPPNTQYLGQTSQQAALPTSSAPAPAHTGLPLANHGHNSLLAQQIQQATPNVRYIPPSRNPVPTNRPRLPQMPNNSNFIPQALPVRPAYHDFLRQVQNSIPGVDLMQLAHQLASNPNQGITLSVPGGVDTAAVQQQLQQSLENSMLQALTNPNIMGSNNTSSMVNDILNNFLPRNNNPSQPPPQAPPRNLPPPSEDEMARQDQDAEAHQDEEYHEVETYADYVPAKLNIGEPHPDPVVETSSLSTVEPPDIEYNVRLPLQVINDGLLSALQLESVIYACQQHDQFLADNCTRRGFLIGDGAGVGKGRTIAGIIYENYLCGRKKSIWLSVSTDLKLDAERDLKDIGAKRIPVYLLNKFNYGRRINIDSGVIFTTYSGLVSQSQSIRGSLGSRIEQLINWVGKNFDGVIVFDECHKAKNISMAKNKKNQSKAAAYAVEIQERLPRARVVYASATGASETKHLGYMTRLGIWGGGTAYATFTEFCNAIERRGVGAMELVAVDLKMRGSYIARQLSFKTTSFEIRVAELDDKFVRVYDECVDLWALALRYFLEASDYFSHEKKKLRTLWASFWAAHQKFFKYLCIGAKVPLVIEIAKKALEDGKCVVIGLQSTGESKTLEALDDGDINEFISTAKATFESLVDNHFPAPYSRPRAPQSSSKPNLLSASSSATASDSPSTGSSSTVEAEKWEKSDAVKFVVQNGVVMATVGNDTKADKVKPATGGNLKNKQALEELAREKRKKRETRSSRALRAKRRALGRTKAKSRIKVPDEDSDTEISNPLSTSTSPNEDTSDETYSGSGSGSGSESDSYSGDEASSTVVNSTSETEISAPSPARKAEDDSDSDVQITAVKPRRNYEVVILSSDEDEDDDGSLDPDDPMSKHGPRLIKMRDELYKAIDDVGPRLPNNTLDDLIDRLGGASKVAEMTGRKGRIVKDEAGLITYKQRNETDALENLNIAEKGRFMSGQKLVAIISEAASSGISLQADKRIQNKRRRVHITIELPWSADRAIQQFGRTHRSNQTSGPEYVFIISELAGEKRFASIVAKRLESLGALTHGDRRATTESRDLSQFNLNSKYSKQALDLLYRYIDRDSKFANIKPDYKNETDFIYDARRAFMGAGLARGTDHIFMIEAGAIQVNHFLNRLLGMKVQIQNSLFKLFTDYMDRLIQRNKVSGNYDAGILELNSESGKTKCEDPEDFHLKTQFGTVKCTLRNVRVERGISWDEAVNMLEESQKNNEDSRSGFYVSTNRMTKANLVSLVIREPRGVDLFRVYKPNTGRSPKPDYYSFISEKADKCSRKHAESIWRDIFNKTDTKCVHMCHFNSCKRIEARLKCNVGLRHRKYCILSGGILTAWPYLEKKAPEVTTKLQIVRLRVDPTNRVIGPIIPQDSIDRVKNLLRAGKDGIEF